MKMKQILNKLFLFGILGSFVLLYSCGGDDPEEPTIDPPSLSISVTGGELNAAQDELIVDQGSELTFTVSITAPGGFNTFRLTQTSGNPVVINEQTRNDIGVDAGTPDVTVTVPPFSYTSGDVAELTFTVADDSNPSQSTDAVVAVTINARPAEVRTAVLLAAPTGDNTSQTFYSVGENRTYSNGDVTGTAAAVSQNIDFGYYYGATANASISSPNDYPTAIYDLAAAGWGTRNITSLVKGAITSSAYAELSSVASVETALSGVDFTSAPETVTGLVADDIIAFKTAGDVEGFIKVVSITGTDGSNGRIELELILAQEAAN